jgi:UDP-N-acetylglucosamine--N-acetylmuramyl-(pentapeptide) pyrophosphoryl-undecaprenol N-acetylglucosamine transferase
LVVESIQHLRTLCQVIHLSGLERPQALVAGAQKLFPECYHLYQFFGETEMQQAYAAANLIISRGGFGSLSEIAALGKPAIIVPKPGHQEENVRFLADAGAVLMVDERIADGNYLAKIVKELLNNPVKQNQMSVVLQKLLPVASDDKIIDILSSLL